MKRLSIIVPALNESPHIAATLQALAPLRSANCEIIVVDGGSTDNTAELARPYADLVVESKKGRARQMNAGAAHAQTPVLLFLHADTMLPPKADALVLSQIEQGAVWGRFNVHLAGQHPMLPVIATLMNWRSWLTGIATGDQALFVRRDLFTQMKGFPDQPLMEDIALSTRLRKISRPACIRARLTTSGRRWDTHGAWRTIFLMWRLRWLYWRGTPAHELAKYYL